MRTWGTKIFKVLFLAFAFSVFWCDRDAYGAPSPFPGDTGLEEELPVEDVTVLKTGAARREAEIYEADGIRMSFSYGFENTAKSGRLIPFDVEITNFTLDEFSGTLYIETEGSIEDGTGSLEDCLVSYLYPVCIPPGESGHTRSTISMSSASGSIGIFLCDQSDTLITSGTAKIELSSGSESSLLVGVLSKTPERLEFLKNLSLQGTGLRTKTVELHPESLPESASGFEQLDILVVSNFDTELVSEESLSAIEQWVSSGGVLIIGTGTDTSDAEMFGRSVEGLTLSPKGLQTVNMGIRYSHSDDPDDASIELNICDVFAAGGIEVMQSDDIAMLTRVSLGSGAIVIGAYDLTDLDVFCREEIGYAEEILTESLGAYILAEAAGGLDTAEEYFDTAMGIVGVSDTPGYKNLLFALSAGICFILVIIAIFFYLRAHNLSIFYPVFVMMAAFILSALLWLMGKGYSDTDLNLSYAFVRQTENGQSQEKGFFLISSDRGEDISFSAPEEYEIYPIVCSTEESSASAGNFVSIRTSPEKEVHVHAEKPFSGFLAEFGSTGSEGTTEGMEAHLTLFDGHITGTVQNDHDYPLTHAAVLCYGQALLLGTIEAHETVSIENLPTVYYPVGHSELLAEYILEGASDTLGMREERLLQYFLDDFLYWYFDGARIIAFSEGSENMPAFGSEKRISSRGEMLLSETADMDFSEEIWVSKNALASEPVVVSGDYDFVTNSVSGAVVLEYSLGADISSMKLSLKSLSPEFETDLFKAFDGTISFYNYESGAYDYIADSEAGLTGASLSPYLSPGNTITVRYTPSDAISKVTMYLPMPEVIGTKGDNNA